MLGVLGVRSLSRIAGRGAEDGDLFWLRGEGKGLGGWEADLALSLSCWRAFQGLIVPVEGGMA